MTTVSNPNQRRRFMDGKHIILVDLIESVC
jgi:hypothetical protein